MDQANAYPISIQRCPHFVLNFLPFERTLLENVIASDRLLGKSICTRLDEVAIAALFERWGPAERTRGALLDLADEISHAEAEEAGFEIRGELTPSVQARERCYRAFIGILDTPSYLNEGRGKSADKHNGAFKRHFLQATDISNLLRSPSDLVAANLVEDSRYWKILDAMMTMFPDKMKLWTSGMQLTGEFLPSRNEFEVWQVARMYLTHLFQPNVGSHLLDLLQREPYQDLGERIWEEKKKENQRAKQGWEIFIAEREALRKDERVEDSGENAEGGSNGNFQTFDVRFLSDLH